MYIQKKCIFAELLKLFTIRIIPLWKHLKRGLTLSFSFYSFSLHCFFSFFYNQSITRCNISPQAHGLRKNALSTKFLPSPSALTGWFAVVLTPLTVAKIRIGRRLAQSRMGSGFDCFETIRSIKMGSTRFCIAMSPRSEASPPTRRLAPTSKVVVLSLKS